MIQLVEVFVEPARNLNHVFQIFVRERHPFPLRILPCRGYCVADLPAIHLFLGQLIQIVP